MSSDLSDASTTTTRSRTVCALCRQRKTKCDRQLPKCSFCVKAKAHCQYVPQQKKRGLRAGYVSELESRIASLETQVESLQNSPRTIATPSLAPLETPQRSAIGTLVNNLATEAGTHRNVLASHDFLSETDSAAADMVSLPQSYFHQLVDLWFKEDHHWAPILDPTTLQQSLAALPDPVDHIPDVVLRAVIALKVAYSSQAISLGYKGRRKLSMHLRSQVLVEAMANPSLSSIQALYIIGLLDIGSDDIPSTLNIMSMCRRTGEHIGIFRHLLQRIQSQSPGQVGLPNLESFTTDNHSIAITWAVIAIDSVTSIGVSWRDASAALEEHLSGIACLNVPDFRDSFRTHIHLCTIGLNRVHEFFFAYAQGEHEVLQDKTFVVVEDIYQSIVSYINGVPTTHYTILADGAVDYDINYVFTRIVANATVMMVYQRYTLDEIGESQLARERCLVAYHQIVDILRNISDADTEINSPLFVTFIAIAVRYKLILVRALGETRGPDLDVLMHGVNMCGRRWPLARRIDIVLRAAFVEIDNGGALGAADGVPDCFWDLKQSGLDISETIKRWVHEYKAPLYVGSLNGPYA